MTITRLPGSVDEGQNIVPIWLCPVISCYAMLAAHLIQLGPRRSNHFLPLRPFGFDVRSRNGQNLDVETASLRTSAYFRLDQVQHADSLKGSAPYPLTPASLRSSALGAAFRTAAYHNILIWIVRQARGA
jgi:hypothetical protein